MPSAATIEVNLYDASAYSIEDAKIIPTTLEASAKSQVMRTKYSRYVRAIMSRWPRMAAMARIGAQAEKS